MTQQKKLEDYDSYDLLWATVKYDELLQVVLQNIILVERKQDVRIIAFNPKYVT